MEKFSSGLPPWFSSFMAINADRSRVIKEVLDKKGIKNTLLELEGAMFVLAWPKNTEMDEYYRVKIISAHHDRVPGSPGALDNSAACLQLVNFLEKEAASFNTMAVFTDREELGYFSPMEQGSFLLSKAIESYGFRDTASFPLDVTGCGDSLVISLAPMHFSENQNAILQKPGSEAITEAGKAAIKKIAEESMDLADSLVRMMAGRAPVYCLSLPFGEDLGYILAGMPSVLASVLPRPEADALAAGSSLPAWASLEQPGCRSPATWQILHSREDSPEHFTASAFDLMDKYLTRLACLKLPARIKG
ncbi:hypothetical protein MASR2M29_16220 [Spirochaetota bacterium]